VTDQLSLGGAEIRAMRSDLRAQERVEMEQDYRDVMRTVARDTQTPLIDCVRRVADVPVLLFLDDVHPNEQGHALIGSELADRLSETPVLRGSP
jgi:lysophospholipase L1-like esterase